MKNAWKIKGFQRDETHRKCMQKNSGDQDRGKLEISLWLTPHVGSNPTRSANEKSSNHNGFWVFRFFCFCAIFCPSGNCSLLDFGENKLRFSVIFFDSNPSAAEMISFRQADSFHHRLCRGQLGSVVQVGVDIGRGREITVPQPFLNLLERNTVGQKQRRAGVTEIMEAHPGKTVLLNKSGKRRCEPVGI